LVYQNREYRIPLTGKYQLFNASVVLKTLEVLRSRGWTIPEESAAAGLAATNWPARMEMLWDEPMFFLDGGHNPQCIEALAGNLKELFPKKKITFLLGILGDKDYRQMLELLKDLAGSVICVTPNSSRALTGEELLQQVREIMGCHAESADTIEEGIRKALETEKPPVIAVGSLYMAGELRSVFPKVLKQYLRRKAIRGREQLAPEKRKEYSDRIVDTILQTEEFARAKTILSYHAVRAEVSLERLHQIAESRGKTIAYPVCLDSETMEARSPNHPDAYRTGAFGIREPDPDSSAMVKPEEIDLVLCPCAGFDPHGGRIGMGAGYYDRYLQRCRNSRVFAVAFEAQKLIKAPMEDTDIPMDAVITEIKIYSN
jgi:5,10-methenyltetrahydrofolate synthetase